jgi:hypothetical protein
MRRLNEISEKLVYMVKTHMALSVIPVRLHASANATRKRKRTTDTPDSLLGRTVDDLLKVFEAGFERATPLSVADLMNDCIVTVQNVALTVTGKQGKAYEQIRFDSDTMALKWFTGNTSPPPYAF